MCTGLYFFDKYTDIHRHHIRIRMISREKRAPLKIILPFIPFFIPLFLCIFFPSYIHTHIFHALHLAPYTQHASSQHNSRIMRRFGVGTRKNPIVPEKKRRIHRILLLLLFRNMKAITIIGTIK